MSSTITPARPDVFTGTPEQILTDVIRLHGRHVHTFISSRLGQRDWQLAEDLTQEVFVHLWRWHLTRGTVLDDRVYGLLAQIARQMICHHLRTRRNHETALDFTDPAETAARTMTAPASDTPHLAVLYEDLETAQTTLTEAADQYRAANRVHATAQRALRQSVRPEAVTRCTARATAAEADRQSALDAFQTAADRTAQARAAWNSAAGEHSRLAVTR
jgi:DNA-directed RNA polymerase specialized sigma24 family protein